jgi:hypothetical protein
MIADRRSSMATPIYPTTPLPNSDFGLIPRFLADFLSPRALLLCCPLQIDPVRPSRPATVVVFLHDTLHHNLAFHHFWRIPVSARARAVSACVFPLTFTL